jgi:hypothetical protein
VSVDKQIDAVYAAQIAIKHNREHEALTRVVSSGTHTPEQQRFAQLRLDEIEREIKRRLHEAAQPAADSDPISEALK